jgi:two-component system response regulator FimZ (fimbrial Z protein)
VLLAAPHHGLAEGIRSLLSTKFDTVVMVADERSLCKSVEGIRPRLAVVDLSLAQGDVSGLLRRLRECLPGLKVILLSAYDEPIIARAAKEAGAEGLVSKQKIANDLLDAVDGVLQGKRHFPS